MPYVANGIFKRGYNWVSDQAAGIFNLATRQQADAEDIAAGLSVAMLRDGTSTATADLPMGSHTLTGIRKAVAAGEPVEFTQLSAAGGSVNNRLHNASFNVNQRNVSGTVTLAANAYGHDRWKAGASGCTYTFTQNGPDTTINISAGSLVQIVAAADIDAGTYTLSNAGTAQCRVFQGSYASAPAVAPSPVQSLILAAANATYVEFTTGTVLQPQLEIGTSAHGFNRRQLGLDTVLCQSYFETVPFAPNLDSNQVSPRLPFGFKTTKFAVPTVTVTLTQTGTVTSAVAGNLTVDGMSIQFNTGSTSAVCIGYASVSAEP
jgi:hypothetical protein